MGSLIQRAPRRGAAILLVLALFLVAVGSVSAAPAARGRMHRPN